MLYLASQSPRRQELLKQIGVSFEVLQVDVEESRQRGESPQDYVQRLALDKARAGWIKNQSRPVLGADTIVLNQQQVLEKPRSEDHAVAMLMSLSGCCHQVLSAVALYSSQGCDVALSVTEVHFQKLNEAMVRRYWATGEPRDKAGAYGIQGIGALLVKSIRGSYSGVVGLPIEKLPELLTKHGIATALD